MEKILIIDSSKVTALFLQRTLQKAFFACDTAHSYDEAVEKLAGNKYFVGLSSLILDGGKSGEGVDLLLKNGVPAIAVTSSLNDKIIDELFRKDIVDYVLKKTEHVEYIVRIIKRIYNNRYIKVMVVDDSSSVRLCMADLLRRQGLKVLEAENGRDALEMFEYNSDIKLVLTDYKMPDLDGKELLASLRKKHPMDKLSIIVLSSDTDARISPFFLKTGANDFIHKSASVEEILCRINSNLDTLELLEDSYNRASIDFLTGLWNRRAFFEHAELLFEKSNLNCNELSLAMIDIDHFKTVNDTYGHDMGDLALKTFALMLGDYVGDKGFAARFVGEEFVVLLDKINPSELYDFLDGFRADIENLLISQGGKEFRFTVSIGALSDTSIGLKDMISKADDLLYKVKSSGRNKVLCEL